MNADVPSLVVPRCALQTTDALFRVDSLSNVNGSQPSKQAARGSICWNETGITVREYAVDDHIFSPYTRCDQPVFVDGDVLEVFIAPVLKPTDSPQWYFELDTSASGVLWAGLSNNSKGNASTCVSVDGCTASGPLPCSGWAHGPRGLTAHATNHTDMWSTRLFIPWAIFAPEFRPRVNGSTSSPWRHWRLNFYRYDYPGGPGRAYELVAWSPTHDPSFHVPTRFGVAVFK
eukprot:7221392-Prymnesium_polylepis.1